MAKHQPNQRVQCPHCRTAVRLEVPSSSGGGNYWTTIESSKYLMRITYAQCPQCLQFLLTVEELEGSAKSYKVKAEHLMWPRSSTRDPVPQEVPKGLAGDYEEAALVLPFSPKASAALSRRCLQIILRESGHTKSKNLSDQIDEVLPSLPSYIVKNLDAVRAVGNFAAHPLKSQSTGEIIEVEPGEAEWNLDVLDALFDFYYTKPALEQKKRDELNQKLKDAGKPPMKE